MAVQRHVSEPILWHDSETQWEKFSTQLEAKGIRTLRGGKFIHLMGRADKADGFMITRELYKAQFPISPWTTVAVGDSANDQSMLESADIAIVIPHSTLITKNDKIVIPLALQEPLYTGTMSSDTFSASMVLSDSKRIKT